MTLQEASEHIGDSVIYRHTDGRDPEQGIITSVNNRYVFVRYQGDKNSKATAASELELLSPLYT